MTRIFPVGRVVTGAIIFIGTTLFSVLIFCFDHTASKTIEVLSLPIAVAFVFSLPFLTAHISFDSEKLVSWTIFRRKTVRFEDILQITRKWERRVRGGAKLYYRLCYLDRENRKEKYVRIFLPENYKSKKVQSLIAQIKSVNHDFEFLFEFY